MAAGQSSSPPIYRDTHDLTPFGHGRVRPPVREIAAGVGGLIHGVLGGRDAALLKEVLRRRKTNIAPRNDALTDRALLVLDNGRRSLNPRDWQRRTPADLEPPETLRVIRRDSEMHELWDREYGGGGVD
ncbi:hypothetical protein V3C33_17865 [Micrococcaceae bacterium Sec5.7]